MSWLKDWLGIPKPEQADEEMVTITLHENGRRVEKKVPKKFLDDALARGDAVLIPTCKAHILSPDGVTEEIWRVGHEISEDTFKQFDDGLGNIYVLIHYEEGEQEINVITKDFWEMARQALC